MLPTLACWAVGGRSPAAGCFLRAGCRLTRVQDCLWSLLFLLHSSVRPLVPHRNKKAPELRAALAQCLGGPGHTVAHPGTHHIPSQRPGTRPGPQALGPSEQQARMRGHPHSPGYDPPASGQACGSSSPCARLLGAFPDSQHPGSSSACQALCLACLPGQGWRLSAS